MRFVILPILGLISGACAPMSQGPLLSGDSGDTGDIPTAILDYRDTFVQEAPMIDVLLAIDTSASMDDEVDEISREIPRLLNGLGAAHADYHIGVITLDTSGPHPAGALVEYLGDRWVDPTTPAPAATVISMMQGAQRLGGSAHDSGRDTIYSALLVNSIGVNQGFQREMAALHVVVLSDEDDRSDGLSRPDFISWYDGLEGAKGDTAFSSVVGPQTSCSTAEPGLEYHAVSQAVGGEHSSICAPDWSRVFGFDNVAKRALNSTFSLSRWPDPSTVQVTVTRGGIGMVLTPADWVFDPTNNEVTIVGASAGAGDVVDISYSPAL